LFGTTLDLFVLPGSHTQMTAVPIGDSDLWAMSNARPREFRRLVELAVESVPGGVTAHRLGDFVFTYHDIDLRSPDPDLWIFITCADPDQNQTAAIDGKFYAGGATGGDIEEIPVEAVRAAPSRTERAAQAARPFAAAASMAGDTLAAVCRRPKRTG
jgi:hypothetical protein